MIADDDNYSIRLDNQRWTSARRSEMERKTRAARGRSQSPKRASATRRASTPTRSTTPAKAASGGMGIEMRRSGDGAWERFETQRAAAAHFAISSTSVSELVRGSASAGLTAKFDVRRAASGHEARPPLWRVLVLASRPNTLTASLTPVLVGSAVARAAFGQKAFAAAPCLEFWLFAALIQIGTNLHNDYADFVKGADTHERVGQTARGASLALALALAVGAHLTATRPNAQAMAFVTLTSTFNAVAYTGGPYPLGYVGLGWVSIGYAGLGDLFVLLYFGGVATSAPYYLQAGAEGAIGRLPPLELALAVAAMGSLGTAIIVVNNLRDRHTDVKAKKHTLAVRFGATFAKAEYASLLGAAYALALAAPFLGAARTWWLPLLSLPLAVGQLRAVVVDKDGAALNPHVGGTAKLQLAYGLLLVLAIALA